MANDSTIKSNSESQLEQEIEFLRTQFEILQGIIHDKDEIINLLTKKVLLLKAKRE